MSAYVWFLLAEDAGNTSASDAVRRSEAQMRAGGVEDGLFRIVDMYEKGEDLAPDSGQAAKWCRKAAERGIPKAQIMLAQILSKGKGVPQDNAEARLWCEAAERQKYAMGDYCLGQIFRIGLGVQKDPSEAEKWYEKAAQRADGPAMLQLGEMYRDGDGVKADRVTAYSWMLLATIVRTPNAEKELTALKQNLSEKEIAKAKEKAADFLRAWPRSTERIQTVPKLH